MNELTFVPSRAEFIAAAQTGNVIPVYVDVVADAETPVSAFRKISGRGDSFLFESAEQNEEFGRFSFLGIDPRLVLQSDGRTISVGCEGRDESFETSADPLGELQKLMGGYRFVSRPELPRFAGGAVGFVGYDTVRFMEPKVPLPSCDELRLPEMIFMIMGTLLIFDHRFRRLKVVVNAFTEGRDAAKVFDDAQQQVERVLSMLSTPAHLPLIDSGRKTSAPEVRSNLSRGEFERLVELAKEYIGAGDVFQVVLSQRFETDYAGDPLDLYRCLRLVNPSPYMFCLKFAGRFSLVGSSPEMHVRVSSGLVQIRPIAGTRPRGETPEEDERNAGDLLADAKERAEHVMLIDLARNDVGRIAEIGSVRLTEQMVIERYSHVMHIVSHVTARLRPEKSAFDVMRATFPAGTVSGAPKVRAMQIISELEGTKRGCYAGAVGYFGFDGSLDCCIALRSVVLKEGRAYVQAGAGIVADSVAAAEYRETVSKARAVIEAVGRASEISTQATHAVDHR
ncbi:MAG TPA: anthranilate synthase component I [Chthoniobacterales bacterium]|nr:anthranilate synthase component I [Chthoniobacterales bacterium]